MTVLYKDMPANSPRQRRLFALALAVKRGETRLGDLPKGVTAIVGRLSQQSDRVLVDFARKRKGRKRGR